MARAWDDTIFAESQQVSDRSKHRVARLETLTKQLEQAKKDVDRLKTGIYTTAGLKQAEDEGTSVHDQFRQVVEEIEGDLELSDEINELLREITARRTEEDRRLELFASQVSWVGLMFYIVLALATVIHPFGWVEIHFKHVHMDFFVAVATAAPILLVAGFVEVAALQPAGAAPTLLVFAVPTLTAGGSALWALAAGRSTQGVDNGSVLGLGYAVIILLWLATSHVARLDRIAPSQIGGGSGPPVPGTI